MSTKRTLAVAGAAAAVAAAGTVVARRRRHAEDTLATLELGEFTKIETSDGAILSVHTAGEGPTVVLAHCWTGEMDTWAPVAAALVDRGHQVIRYDQRGHGRSTTGAEPVSIQRLGTDLRDLLDALDVCDAVVAGHSMGGMGAQAFAIDHPDVVAHRVKALVLAATASAGLGRTPLNRIGPYLVGSSRLDALMSRRAGTTLFRGSHGRAARPAAVRATRDSFVATPARVRLDCLRAINAMDLRDGRSGITVPTTVVLGTRDTLTPPRYGREIAAAIPGARLIGIPGAGHMLPYEATELLTDLITEAASA